MSIDCLPSRGSTLLFATAVAVCVLGLYAPQALVQPLSRTFGASLLLSQAATFSLFGYAMGLLLVVPIIDIHETRAVILIILGALAGSLACAALAPTAGVFVAAVFLAGVSASVIQMLVPTVAALTPPARRGLVIGNVMSGLMLGIMLSRPLASFSAGAFGWRGFYAAVAALVGSLALWLPRSLPFRPAQGGQYLGAVASLASIVREEPQLRRRALSQALLMAAFNCFWGSVALRLAGAGFDLGPFGIGAFAFSASGGIVAAPMAGRMADAGRTRATLVVAHAMVVVALVGAMLAGAGAEAAKGHAWAWLGLLVLSTILLDAGVIADQTLGRRTVNLLNPAARGRINGLYTGLFFLGSTVGAAVSGPAWHVGGWRAVCMAAAGFAFAAIAMVVMGATCPEDLDHTSSRGTST